MLNNCISVCLKMFIKIGIQAFYTIYLNSLFSIGLSVYTFRLWQFVSKLVYKRIGGCFYVVRNKQIMRVKFAVPPLNKRRY
jgi:hypothetical protein